MLIDAVSDTVCPWCYIGKRRLARAIAMRPGIEIRVHWRPYRLDPTIPPEGIDRRAYLKAKFGDNPRVKSMGEVIRKEGAQEGIAFAFEKIARSPNTLDSHRLIRWAASARRQDQVVERLFDAYFVEGRDIGDKSVLIDVASAAGLDAKLVAELLRENTDTDLIEHEDALAH
jgi:predicted DsbA family dithiol-disulfide isomerase